jgi:anti-sigma factor RsiW
MFVENDLRITCSDAVELVTDYLDGALAAADFENFTRHLTLCEGCLVYTNQLKQTIRLVGELHDGSIEVRPSNFDALVNKLKARRRSD